MSDIFFVRLGRRGNLFANLNRVVMEGSRGLGKRLKRQDEGVVSCNVRCTVKRWATVASEGRERTAPGDTMQGVTP